MNGKGFTLVEVLIALLLLSISILAVLPLFVHAMRSNASAGEIGSVSAVANQRMELLTQIPFDNLTAGGSLTADSTGYFDDSDPDVLVRWRVTDDATPPTLKTVEVRGIALRTPMGGPKELLLVGLAAEE